jgi:two-component system, sensor histidine kinase YesM
VKKPLSFGTLESRIYTIFTLMIFITIFIMQLVSFNFTINRIRNSFIESNQAMLDQLVDQVDTYITGMKTLSLVISGDRDVQEFLARAEGEDPEAFRKVESRLHNYTQARDDISDILIVALTGGIVSSDPASPINPWTRIEQKPWYTEALDAFDATVVSTSYVQNLILGRYSWVVSLSRGIQDAENNETLGVLLVDLKFNRIKELCQSLVIGDMSYNFIIDHQGNYIYHPTQQLLYSNLRSEPLNSILPLLEESQYATYNDGDRYYMIATSPLTGWHMVSVMHESDIITDWRYVRLSYSLIGLVIFLVVGIATNRISSGITEPVRKLQDIMKSVDTGEFQRVGSIRATDEIRELAREYDIMVGRIRELMEANIREQEQKRKSDLKALQAQINPHFLYNTLDSIIWMAEMGQNRQVVQMTSALSKLFRISISKGRELIPIGDEIAHVQSYLTIQEMRYRDKFSYEIDIDPSLHDETTLKITLQPLVENAIYHGIKEVDHKGHISISGRREDETILLEIRDNGRGMQPEQLEELIASIESPLELWPGKNRQGGMGVKNVHERMRIYFGPDYGLTIRSVPGEGTRIEVRFPSGFSGERK